VPVKIRTPKGRRQVFSQAVCELFAELDSVPSRQRGSAEFQAKDRELHRLLGLGYAWLCAGASVTDRRSHLPPPWLSAYADCVKARRVREVLLEATRR
jgi:hypothetical protein